MLVLLVIYGSLVLHQPLKARSPLLSVCCPFLSLENPFGFHLAIVELLNVMIALVMLLSYLDLIPLLQLAQYSINHLLPFLNYPIHVPHANFILYSVIPLDFLLSQVKLDWVIMIILHLPLVVHSVSKISNPLLTSLEPLVLPLDGDFLIKII